MPYSAEARARFADVSAIVRSVRHGLGASVADIVQLAIRRLDLDVETAVAGTGASADLAALVDVADDVTGRSDVDSLTGFLSYLRAEEEFGTGLEVPDRARPGAVQVLTIHTAKGLEWDRVFVPFVVGGTFPSAQGREKWTSNPQGFPYPLRGDADVLPRLTGWTSKGLSELGDQFRRDALSEEVRLAYVAFTRARTALHVSGHWWGRTQVKPRPASEYLEVVAEVCAEQGRPVRQWSPPPAEGANPELDVHPVAWPRPQVARPRRERAAELVRAARAGRLAGSRSRRRRRGRGPARRRRCHRRRDRDPARGRRSPARSRSRCPASLSTTAVLDLVADEQAFARSLARPMPRRPSTAARFGTRFHAWVEAHYGLPVLLDPTELPGRGDADLGSDAELDRVRADLPRGPVRRAEAGRHRGAVRPDDRRPAGDRTDRRGLSHRRRRRGRRLEDQCVGHGRSAPAGRLPPGVGRAQPAFPSTRCPQRSTTCGSARSIAFAPTDLPDRAELERRLVPRPSLTPWTTPSTAPSTSVRPTCVATTAGVRPTCR